MWMGLIWIGLGIFFLVRGGFMLPRINIELGWIVLGLGALRVYWWWLSVEKPRREKAARRLQTQALLEETDNLEETPDVSETDEAAQEEIDKESEE